MRERRRWRDLWHVHTLTEARRHADDEIRRLNEELEQRVLDRTAELRASEERARAMFEAARTHQGHLAHVLRVTTMGGMVAELAHELNQPLGAIVNFANGTDGAPAAERRRPRAHRHGDAASPTRGCGRRRSSAGSASSSDPAAPSAQPVDLNSVVREAALLIESEARRDHIPLRLQLDPSLSPVPADRIQVEQVILNLIRNAIEAMRASGRWRA